MKKKLFAAFVLVLMALSVMTFAVLTQEATAGEAGGGAYDCWRSCNRACGPPSDPNYENCMDSCMYTCEHPIELPAVS